MHKFFLSGTALWSNAICLLRIWCGVIFARYGATILHPDAFYEFADTLKTAHIPFPLLSAVLCKGTELLGGTLLITGLFLRPACFCLMIDMFVATFIFHHGHVLNNGLTTFLLLTCLLNIFSNKADAFTIDHFIEAKAKQYK